MEYLRRICIRCMHIQRNMARLKYIRLRLIVSNPPYSIKWAGDENPLLINDPRFAPAGVLAPKSKADMAFIMHSLAWLASNGTYEIIMIFLGIIGLLISTCGLLIALLTFLDKRNKRK